MATADELTAPSTETARGEAGFMLVELLISLTFLAVAVGALLSVYATSVLVLRHSSIEGNSLSLADKQMEIFKTLDYDSIGIDTSTVPGGADVYITSPPTNLTSGQQATITSGQVNAGAIAAAQTVTGPDHRSYRIDCYVFATAATGGYEGYKQVTVDVRPVTAGVVGAVAGQATSAFDPASTQSPPA